MGVLRNLLRKLTGSSDNSRLSDRDENFVCGACRSPFQRKHQNCPNCGSPILVAVDESDVDDS